MASEPFLDCRDLSKSYGSGDSQVIALQGVSLSLNRGESLALLGQSGSGKSTLLNLLGAVDRPTTGGIQIDGQPLANLTDNELALFRRRHLGFVFQSFHLVPSLCVFDNVAIPWTLDRSLTADRRIQITALLDRLGLAGKQHRYPEELSGGQQQRVAIARAVVHRPALVLADEPTGNLDATTGNVILDLLDELRREFGIAMIIATHSEQAAARCTQSIHLRDGRVMAADLPLQSSQALLT